MSISKYNTERAWTQEELATLRFYHRRCWGWAKIAARQMEDRTLTAVYMMASKLRKAGKL